MQESQFRSFNLKLIELFKAYLLNRIQTHKLPGLGKFKLKINSKLIQTQN